MKTLPLLVGCLLLAGCAIAGPKEAQLFTAQARNAEEFTALVKEGEVSQSEIIQWLEYDVRSWKALAAWARGESPYVAAESD